MKCEKIRDLLLTDYIDGQMNAGLKKKVEEHLTRCKQCREFLHSVEETYHSPFKQTEEKMPPEFVWQRIRSDISKSRIPLKQTFPASSGFLTRLFALPKPAYVLAALIILVSAIFLKEKRNTAVFQRQYQYLEYYASLTDNGFNNDEVEESLIEEYFL